MVNGRKLGTVWKPPYRIDLTALKPGENQLEIGVTNQWTNRLAGDRTAPADKKVLASGGGGFGPAGAAALAERRRRAGIGFARSGDGFGPSAWGFSA